MSKGGSRGGADQFKWDDLQQMNYKDREQYLGFSQQLGYLDKGGKWRKKDWWTGNKGQDDDAAARKANLDAEKLQAKKEDDALLDFKLGKTSGCSDIS